MDPKTASKALRKAADYIDAQLAAGKNPSRTRVARIVGHVSRVKNRVATGPLGRKVEDFYEKTFKQELPEIKWWATSDFTEPEERALQALYDKIQPDYDEMDGAELKLSSLARELDKILKTAQAIRKPRKQPFKSLLEKPLEDAIDAVQKARDEVAKAHDAYEEVNGAEQMWWVDISDDFVHGYSGD